MRVQRFVALYKEPFETRKKLYRRGEKDEEIFFLREEVVRKEHKNKRLEGEIDELEAKNKNSKKQLD